MNINTTYKTIIIESTTSIISPLKPYRKAFINLSFIKTKGLSLLSAFIIILSFSTIYAQEEGDKVIDFSPYLEATSTEKKIEFLYALHTKNSISYSKGNTKHHDTVQYFIRDLHAIGLKENNPLAIGLSAFTLGFALYKKSHFKEAESKLNIALNNFKNVENDTLLVEPLNLIGNIYFLKGEMKTASSYYLEALAISKTITEKTTDRKFEMIPLINLANIDIAHKDYEDAEEKILEIIEFYSQSRNLHKLSSSYALLAENYMNKNEIQLAIDNFIISMKYGLATGNHKDIASAYTNLGIAEFFSENYKRSEEYFKLAVEYRIKEGNSFKEGEGYYNLGDFYSDLKKMDSAIVYYQKAIDVANSGGYLVLKKDALLQKSTVYSSLRMKDKQIEVLKEVIELQDELAKIQLKGKTDFINLSFEQNAEEQIGKSKNREGQLLNKLNNFQSIFNNWILVSSVGLGGLAFFLYFRRKKKGSI